MDVYYEFRKAGIQHRVVIACKDTKRPVEKVDLLEFREKLNDSPNTIGVVISRSGYRAGFLKYAEHHGRYEGVVSGRGCVGTC